MLAWPGALLAVAVLLTVPETRQLLAPPQPPPPAPPPTPAPPALVSNLASSNSELSDSSFTDHIGGCMACSINLQVKVLLLVHSSRDRCRKQSGLCTIVVCMQMSAASCTQGGAGGRKVGAYQLASSVRLRLGSSKSSITDVLSFSQSLYALVLLGCTCRGPPCCRLSQHFWGLGQCSSPQQRPCQYASCARAWAGARWADAGKLIELLESLGWVSLGSCW